ncbi:Hypp7318 [Branchiostoma lanceolatum]|uniref:Hypp7318 protein n=1 Tax=Branchiostoma lanceolatum TaxID=7740 RepID=A0A8K0ECV1_BRALA|nr:Hypp7318 [Branchiostoma lanceolatum]
MSHSIVVVVVCVSLVAGVCSVVPVSDIENCRYTGADGNVYDLSPLIAKNGAYVFDTRSYNINGYNILSPEEARLTELKYTYHLQICRNVTNPPDGCKGSSPIFRVDIGLHCASLGSIDAAIFEINPLPRNDGVHLLYYHGDLAGGSRLQRYHSSIYFVCNNRTEIGPLFEHQTDFYQSHFVFQTIHACRP